MEEHVPDWRGTHGANRCCCATVTVTVYVPPAHCSTCQRVLSCRGKTPPLTLFQRLAVLHKEKHVKHKVQPCAQAHTYTHRRQTAVWLRARPAAGNTSCNAGQAHVHGSCRPYSGRHCSPKLPKKKKFVKSRHTSPFLNIKCALKYTLKGVMTCGRGMQGRGNKTGEPYSCRGHPGRQVCCKDTQQLLPAPQARMLLW